MEFTKEQHQKKVNEFEDICMEMRNLYEAKNWDYRDSFGQSYRKWGLPMSCIRLGDKLNRLDSFALRDSMQVTDEKVEDTLMDLANYAIMTIIELRQKNKKENM